MAHKFYDNYSVCPRMAANVGWTQIATSLMTRHIKKSWVNVSIAYCNNIICFLSAASEYLLLICYHLFSPTNHLLTENHRSLI